MHWVLCAIDPFDNIVYYFDSLHNEEDIGTGKGVSDDLREIVDMYILYLYQQLLQLQFTQFIDMPMSFFFLFFSALFQFRSEMEIATKLKMDTKWKTIKV